MVQSFLNSRGKPLDKFKRLKNNAVLQLKKEKKKKKKKKIDPSIEPSVIQKKILLIIVRT